MSATREPNAGFTTRTLTFGTKGNTLNYRGIPWLLSSVTKQDEWETGHVALHRGAGSVMAVLTSALRDASTARTNFDWSRYLPHLQSHPFSPLTS
ncbi:uncharacterized protein BDZ99DRAFT_158980 [Mytilinidion resinicola]|uniref:Uncharacterized protein n=1 Tax=Mytilinidion resinicola TaxID=574789 RepID=A0A6A6Y6A6_9PEZI|nr:uncharacterized protein BDZ99DRAFT_158980 [Mytilinidion resinicola]KAF2804053.1 hypothetical protein BDZ99DRAFT_158980 [Mytilinidion resinicola]